MKCSEASLHFHENSPILLQFCTVLDQPSRPADGNAQELGAYLLSFGKGPLNLVASLPAPSSGASHDGIHLPRGYLPANCQSQPFRAVQDLPPRRQLNGSRGMVSSTPTAPDWSLFGAAVAVTRECLPISLPHVTRSISDCLDSLSADGTFAASCRRGDSARELSYLFKRNPTPLTRQMVKHAACSGHTHVLRWLSQRSEGDCSLWRDYDFNPIDEAAKSGHLETVKWLHENRSDCYAGRAMSWAAANGHLEMVQWLHKHRNDFCATFAMDFAAANGRLEVLEWLHCNRSDGCTTWAMDGAAQNNHLSVVQWLHANRSEGCTKAAINGAAANGHLGMVQWLLDNVADGVYWRGWAFVAAVDKGQLEVAQWVFATFHEYLSDFALGSALSAATDNGHKTMAQWLMEQRVR